MEKTDKSRPKPGSQRKCQLSSFVLFVSVIILVNLCPFQVPELERPTRRQPSAMSALGGQRAEQSAYLAAQLESCLRFVKLMFTNPVRLGQRTTRFTLAEAKVLGKVAKVLYMKKKLKKLGKKLKKHTIAVPVFTAIPIYEHSYYPSPHVTHVSHAGHMHHSASSYAPVAVSPATQMAASASTVRQQRAYGPQVYGPHQIINAYPPSPPLFVDDSAGLYGHYGNAYGRYDAGYHFW